jgi:aminopeptidase N
MSNQFLTDKSLNLEAAFFGFALDAAPGFAEPGVQAHYAPDRGYTLAHIDLALDIDPNTHALKGEAKLTIEPLPTGLGDVVLDFDDLTIDGIKNAAGEALKYTESDGKLTVFGVAPGGETIGIQWHGNPTRGLYFTGPTDAEPN